MRWAEKELTSPTSDTYTHHTPLGQDVLEQVARLYRAYNHVDLTSQANREGGVHFNRSAGWFRQQMSLEGAHLITRTDKLGVIVCFALFFTNPATFPSFAQECRELTSKPGLAECAYMYLILTDSSYRGRGLGRETYEMALELCRRLGCSGILHEYYVAPVPNHASMRLLESLERRGFPFTYLGHTTSHERQGIGGGREVITYQQAFVSASRGLKLIGDLERGFRLDEPSAELKYLSPVNRAHLRELLKGYNF